MSREAWSAVLLSHAPEVIVLARDLADRTFPTVTLDSDAAEAARLIGVRRLPGLVVLDDTGVPYAILPGSQVLRFVIPPYVQDDPTLARIYDEKHADLLSRRLAGTPVRHLLHAERTEAPVVHRRRPRSRSPR